MNIKDTIADVVFILSMKNGFDGVSIKQIQDVSGIATGSIYYHFKDKDEILHYMVNRYIVEDFDQMKEEVMNLKVPFIKKIEFIYKYTFECYNKRKAEIEDISTNIIFDYKEYWTLYTSIYHQHPGVRHIFHELSDKLHELYCELIEEAIENKEIRDDVDSKSLSLFIQSNVKGHIYLYVYQPNFSFEEIIAANIKMIQEAIR